jgi:hypothetical protein
MGGDEEIAADMITPLSEGRVSDRLHQLGERLAYC